MTEKVRFRKSSYSAKALKPAIFELLDQVSALDIGPRARVLIKPNFLAPAKPHLALTTHPLVLRAAVEYVLDRGGHPLVADSPGMGSFQRLVREGGYAEALQGLAVELRPFVETRRVDIGEPFGKIELAREALEADAVINLPKLKTHAMMLLTLGVKNCFGCIVGLAKPRWHMRSGIDRGMFARLLVQICRRIRPAATLVDGILALEGQGPGRSGKPRELGVLAAGRSAFAVDAAICRLVGVRPEELPTHRAALGLGLAPVEVLCDGEFTPVGGFRLPTLGPLTFGPRALQPLIRRHCVQRPAADRESCRMCGECWRACPAKAITPQGRVRIEFDYERCIRCYCCIEMCPHGALKAIETGMGRLLRRATALRDRVAQRGSAFRRRSPH